MGFFYRRENRKIMRHKKLALATLSLILLIGTASAALVYYLSNTVSMTANVTSPIELKLFEPDGTEITSALELKGGGSVDFSKIAYNLGESSVPFAIVLVIEGTLGEGIIVDSVGPIEAEKQNIGGYLWEQNLDIWNRDDLWCQIEGEAWYLHDAYNKYDAYFDDNYALWGNPQNMIYDDGGGVTIDTTDYYVIVFGGTIGPKNTGLGAIYPAETITNWGWGTPTTYYERDADTPCIMPGESYDVGKVRVIFAPNFQGSVAIKMQVVMPGSTVAEIIDGMFP